MASAKIYALLVILHNFERDVNLGSGAKLAFYYNAQFVLIDKSLNAAFAQVSATLNAMQWAAKNLIRN